MEQEKLMYFVYSQKQKDVINQLSCLSSFVTCKVMLNGVEYTECWDIEKNRKPSFDDAIFVGTGLGFRNVTAERLT